MVSLQIKWLSGSDYSYCRNGGDLVTVTGLVSPFTYMYPLSSDPAYNKMFRRYRNLGDGNGDHHSSKEETLLGVEINMNSWPFFRSEVTTFLIKCFIQRGNVDD